MKKASVVIIFGFILLSCGDSDSKKTNIDYRESMREFVIGISKYAKALDANFLIIPQNGQELVTDDGSENGNPVNAYLNAIDGVGREDLLYGYDNDNIATSPSDTTYMMAFLDICEANSVEVLVTDYCWEPAKINDSNTTNESNNYISFAAPDRELNLIPANPYNPNTNIINNLSDAQNFLYLINFNGYATKTDLINALSGTDYDLIIMDLFFNDEAFTPGEINQLKTKNSGGTRLLISYMSIGEAENYRYYWQPSWSIGNPSWIIAENPDWPGNYVVEYWQGQWQSIIFGNDASYLKKIIDAGFDGVYLDIIDAFESFE